uniref:Uncharacterized protein n=1 Tax=Rhizophora mucronata TaxID=61149 RepID=A0A2P2PET1_RHIMU
MNGVRRWFWWRCRWQWLIYAEQKHLFNFLGP